MRSQTHAVSQSVHILTVGFRGVLLSEVDCNFLYRDSLLYSRGELNYYFKIRLLS